VMMKISMLMVVDDAVIRIYSFEMIVDGWIMYL